MRSAWRTGAAALALIALLAPSGCSNSSDSSNPTAPPVPVPGTLNFTLFATLSPGTLQASAVLATAAPGDTGRVFLVQKSGQLRIVKHNVLLATPFLNISGLVSAGSEQGLLGMAFAPDYATSGVFYVSYTNTAGDSRLARYHVSATNPDIAVAGTGLEIFRVTQPASNHNGGMIAFGPDGYLYFSLGDGGNQYDPTGTGQDKTDLLASILRLDVSGAGDAVAAVGNPWYSGAGGARPELWAIGFRNPWRFSFDRANGDLYIGDVGQDDWEEVDVATAASGGGAGRNYGWSVKEGTHCHPAGTSSCDSTGMTGPVREYPHSEGRAVIGGYVYRGSAISGLQGLYFYSDNNSKFLRSFRISGGVATQSKDWGMTFPSGPTGFGEDANGELYVCMQNGQVLKLRP